MSKEAWKAAKAELDIIEAERDRLIEPIKEKLDAARERLALIEEETGVHIFWCEGCSEPIFLGEPYHSGSDVCLCAACSPSYGDLTAHPEMFQNPDCEPMTADEAKALANAHVAAGGSLDDKMVSP